RGRGHRGRDECGDAAARLRPLLSRPGSRCRGLRARTRDRAPDGAQYGWTHRARLRAGPGDALPHRARAGSRSRGGGRVSSILVVDDDPGVLDVVSFMLRREGFEVHAESEGVAALAAARDRRYDIVILDVMLPGMSGTDICRELRAESDLPILML